MEATKKTPEEIKRDVVEELKDLRKGLRYNVILNDIVKHRYEPEEAKAIFIHLALSSLDETDQIIVLGAWQLLPQYQEISRLNDRRKKVKEEIQYDGKPENLNRSENDAFVTIVEAYFNDFIDSSKWENVAKVALNEHYKNGKAILPILPSPATAEQPTETNDAGEENPAPEDGTDEFGSAPEISFVGSDKVSPEDEDTTTFEHGYSDHKKSSYDSHTPTERKHHLVGRRLCLFLALSFIIILLIAPTILRSEKFANTVVLQERYEGDQTWNEELYGAEAGNIIELQLSFNNNWNGFQRYLLRFMNKLEYSGSAKVMVHCMLPDNVEYIENSTVLYNEFYPDGLHISENGIATSGINIGEYYIKDGSYAWGDSYLQIKCKIVNNSPHHSGTPLTINATVDVKDRLEEHYTGVSIYLN